MVPLRDHLTLDMTLPDHHSMLINEAIEILFPSEYENFLGSVVKLRNDIQIANSKLESFNNTIKGRFIQLTTKKQIYMLVTFTTIGVASGILTCIYESASGGIAMISVSLILAFLASCLIPQFFSSALQEKHKLEKALKKHTQDLLDKEAITEIVNKGSLFILEYRKFKENPDAPSIRKVFELFEEIKCTYHEKLKTNIKLENKILGLNSISLNPVAKLILMDNITKDVYGTVTSEWNDIKKLLKDSDEIQFLKPTEPWAFLGIDGPEKSDYIEFAAKMDAFQCIDIEASLINIFRKAL